MNTHITEYAMVRDNDLARLTQQVNLLIQDGWQPHGSPVVAHEAAVTWFHQPMVKLAPPIVLEAVLAASHEPEPAKPTRRSGGAK